MSRRYVYNRDVEAACLVCHGDMYEIHGHWDGKNAQAVAAKHTDATGHTTWVHVRMTIQYMTEAELEKWEAEREKLGDVE